MLFIWEGPWTLAKKGRGDAIHERQMKNTTSVSHEASIPLRNSGKWWETCALEWSFPSGGGVDKSLKLLWVIKFSVLPSSFLSSWGKNPKHGWSQVSWVLSGSHRNIRQYGRALITSATVLLFHFVMVSRKHIVKKGPIFNNYTRQYFIYLCLLILCSNSVPIFPFPYLNIHLFSTGIQVCKLPHIILKGETGCKSTKSLNE